MKHSILLILVLIFSIGISAQAPEKMSYQTVVRDGTDQLVTESTVGIQISILQGSAAGTAVYVETHSPTTNANGLASIEIGGGSIVSGTFSSIDWSNGPYFLKSETDPTGGTSYSLTGTSELLSVPYALFAKNAGSAVGSPWSTSGDDIFNLNSGFVGIGINPPLAKLHVNGAILSNGDQIVNSADGNNAGYITTSNEATSNNKLSIVGGRGGGGILFSTNNAGSINEVMRITNGGAVGIGSASTGAKLHVNGALRVSANQSFHLQGSYIEWSKSGAGGTYFLNHKGLGIGGFVFAEVDNDNNLTERMRISSSGNVGIGTTNPQSKLAVNGKITCKEVEVTLAGFPDYVFDEDYDMLTLDEVEAYIKEHGHLPNVPSAKEVEENGLGLGEMNKILLEKVEELTLHLIEKDKELDRMQHENKEDMSKLKTQIKAIELRLTK